MKVLSLFDGMSCGRIALTELGIPIEQYYASEIDKHAIKQTQLNFPDTVQLGDVTKWREWDIDWKSINLLLAGSPCQGFSFAGKQLAFDDPRSKLFFVFIDILNHIKSVNPDVLFLLENVNMKRSHMRIISEYCGVFPVNINSNLVSAQNRDRWYWTNIRTRRQGLFGEVHSDILQPKDRKIFLRDVLEEKVDEKYYVSQAVIDRMNKPHKNFTPKIDPDKTGCLSTGNNSAKMSFDSGTTFISIDGKAPTQRAATWRSLDKDHNYQFICVAMRGRNPENPSDRRTGTYVEQRLEAKTDGKTNCLTSVLKDNLILQQPRGHNRGGLFDGKTPTLSACAWKQNNLLCTKDAIVVHNMMPRSSKNGNGGTGHLSRKDGKTYCLDTDQTNAVEYQSRIRRLTPTECARLQTVPAWYRWDCSDTQIYRMLGNGWTIEAIMHILAYMESNIEKEAV